MRRDTSAQLITLEALLAALILISAAFFLTNFVQPETMSQGEELSRTQLSRYGQDVMTMVTTKSISPRAGFKVAFYREWNSTEDDGVKWNWDENGTTDGDTYTGTTVDESTSVYDGVGEEWTQDHLVINHSAGENETVWFAAQKRGGSLGNTSRIGKIYLLNPYKSSDRVTVYPDSNSLDFPVPDRQDDDYGTYMAWFESDSGEVSNPIYFWLNATPENHSGYVQFNVSNTEGELDDYWNSASISRRQKVVVDVDSDKIRAGFHVVGPDVDLSTRNKEKTSSNGAVTITPLDTSGDTWRYEVYFEKPAVGGYALTIGPQGSDKWEDPVFVTVGQQATVGRQLSPVDNLLNPANPDYFSGDFEPFLERTMPRNVEYRFGVYSLREGGGEAVAYNSEGEKLVVGENNTPIDPVVVNRFIAASNGSKMDAFNARLELWYR